MRSLAGEAVTRLSRTPPFESPHHGATAAALIGGGSGVIRPGAIARASEGVLFLDEGGEFPASVLDALRQPLESGVIQVHRSGVTATYPARFQLVVATNPCPCGQYGVPAGDASARPRRFVATHVDSRGPFSIASTSTCGCSACRPRAETTPRSR